MTDAYSLPTIPYLRLRVTMRAVEPAALPEYHGSMLRGAFGHALRRSVCTMGPTQPCVSCQLRRACVYTRIFETFVEDERLGPLQPDEPTESRDALTRQVSTWLESALQTWGAGAKTAAGYGYFQSFGAEPSPEV